MGGHEATFFSNVFKPKGLILVDLPVRAICLLQFHNAFPNFRKTSEPEFLFEYTLTLFST